MNLTNYDQQEATAYDPYSPPFQHAHLYHIHHSMQSVAFEYDAYCSDLTASGKNYINKLTKMAHMNTPVAEGLVTVVVQRIYNSSAHIKLPFLHLADSIMKNVGAPYIYLFSKVLPVALITAYTFVTPAEKLSMTRMVNTWYKILGNNVVDDIKTRLSSVDNFYRQPFPPVAEKMNPPSLLRSRQMPPSRVLPPGMPMPPPGMIPPGMPIPPPNRIPPGFPMLLPGRIPAIPFHPLASVPQPSSAVPVTSTPPISDRNATSTSEIAPYEFPFGISPELSSYLSKAPSDLLSVLENIEPITLTVPMTHKNSSVSPTMSSHNVIRSNYVQKDGNPSSTHMPWHHLHVPLTLALSTLLNQAPSDLLTMLGHMDD